MGTSSSHDWQPPSQPQAQTSSGAPVNYHMVASEIQLIQSTDCACYPKTHMIMESSDLYDMLAEQFTQGYRMIYFCRRPGDLRFKMNSSMQAFFSGFFSRKPNLGGIVESGVGWNLRVERTWVQSAIHDQGGFMSIRKSRTVHTAQLVDSIARNTQHGERLVAATETGRYEPPSSGEYSQGFGPHLALDLFFEVPSPATRERYMYTIVLVPVHVEYPFMNNVLFPEIQCDWMTAFQHHLSQGWRLIDIYIDTPMSEQFSYPMKHRRNFCRPTDTNALWILERPVSRSNNHQPLYEGTVVEQTVPIRSSKMGVKSSPDWLPLIQDMGLRGWELTCVVESHKVEGGDFSGLANAIKSLLFFQRPLLGTVEYI